jgi:hypothetical protein
MDGPELRRVSLGSQRLQVAYEAGQFVVRGAAGNAMWRLRETGEGEAPFRSWQAQTPDDCWSIYTEGTRRRWRFAVGGESTDPVVAVAYRHRWRLSTWDIWTVADRWYLLRFPSGRPGSLTDDEHAGLARLSYQPRRDSFIEVEREADAVPGLAMLLLLSLRIAIFTDATRVVPGPTGP